MRNVGKGKSWNLALEADVKAIWERSQNYRLTLAGMLVEAVTRELTNGHVPSQGEVIYPLRVAGALAEGDQGIIDDIGTLALLYNEKVVRDPSKGMGCLIDEIRLYNPEGGVTGRVRRTGTDFEYQQN